MGRRRRMMIWKFVIVKQNKNEFVFTVYYNDLLRNIFSLAYYLHISKSKYEREKKYMR